MPSEVSSTPATAAKLVLRLPPDLHRALRDYASAHERSLNGEIVFALRRYVTGIGGSDRGWGDTEQIAREWTAAAGETLDPDTEPWDHTPEDLARIERMEVERQAREAHRAAR